MIFFNSTRRVHAAHAGRTQRIYIDTSVIGGCFDIEFKEWSIKLLNEFKSGEKIAEVSDITLDELELAREEIR